MKINKQCFRSFIQKTNFRCELSMSNLEISLEISLRLSDISFENSRGLSNFRFDWNNRRFENSTNFERNFVSPEISLYFVEKYRKVAKFGEIRLHSFCTVLYAAVYPYPIQSHPLAGNWHSGCSPHKYALMELPQNVKKKLWVQIWFCWKVQALST